MTQNFHFARCLIKEKKESWNRSLKESQKRDEELVNSSLRTRRKQWRRRPNKEKVTGARKRPRFVERRLAGHSLPPARPGTLLRSLAKMMAKEDSMRDEIGVIAEKLRQNSQSNHTNGMNLANELDPFAAAMEDNGWNKTRKKLGTNVGKVVKDE